MASNRIQPTDKFRILCVDGGGIRGLIRRNCDFRHRIQARTTPQARISDYFHLLAGTSTGGLVALGLTAPDPGQARAARASAPTELAALLRRGRRPRIFHRGRSGRGCEHALGTGSARSTRTAPSRTAVVRAASGRRPPGHATALQGADRRPPYDMTDRSAVLLQALARPRGRDRGQPARSPTPPSPRRPPPPTSRSRDLDGHRARRWRRLRRQPGDRSPSPRP